MPLTTTNATRALLSTRQSNLAFKTRLFSSSSARSKQRVVILGSGWGGYNVLRGIDKKEWGALLSLLSVYVLTPLNRCDRSVAEHLLQFYASPR